MTFARKLSEHRERQQEREAKAKTCAHCGNGFIPLRPMQAVCSPICARRKVDADKKAERERTKERKEGMKTRRDRIAEAQAAVNKYVRLRDIHAGRGCVSCGAKFRGTYGGAFDAGHFRSVGSAPHLRFFTPQIRLQCVRCNRHLSGNVNEYRRGLVADRGAEWVSWLESLYFVAKWDDAYLIRLTRIARKKARRLEKRIEMEQQGVS
jgi:hypothetical protein